ncbi:ganglioside induced differentiation associated protein 2-related [Holotrichia oblita]|nr:ganglioside induced differentiation associated protein 2-related [Holotrichia oblita]
MTQEEMFDFLLKYLFAERGEFFALPDSNSERWRLFRSLVNIREPNAISAEFLEVQDAFLQEEIKERGITDGKDLLPIIDGVSLWRGDITTLKTNAIVNAANSQMLGCFAPCHACIDNAIHTYAGVQLRLECAKIMKEQGRPEPTGKAKLTLGYNLPSKYILHTVGPIVRGAVTEQNKKELADCYRSCLDLAAQNDIRSIAFCCISTGEFHFPNEEAAVIAIKAVSDWFAERQSKIAVVFNVFTERDYDIYKRILKASI